MKFSYNWLKELVPKIPKLEKLVELLNMHAFEVESIERAGKDFVLDISVLPNRIGDASGHIGMARDIAVIMGIKFSLPRAVFKESRTTKVTDLLSVSVQDKNLCTRYMARVIENVHVKESPQWLRERLEVCGLRPINNIVDATNYIMLYTGQPMHAFDYDKLAGGKKKIIKARAARDGEHITTLDDQSFSLRGGMLVIADSEDPLAVAGIKGGKKAEITSETTRIVLEAATFDGPSIRQTSQALGLRTDSSVRFSVGLSATLTETAMDSACALIEKVSGGALAQGMIDTDSNSKKEKAVVISLRTSYVNGLLGSYIKEKEMKDILTRLGCVVTGNGNPLFRVQPPAWRGDMRSEEDLIEEIGRIFGYSNIEAEHSLSELVLPYENQLVRMQERVRDMFAGAGFQEVYNYSFVGETDIIARGDSVSDYVELENPSREEFRYLRVSLVPGLLKNVAENLKHEDAVRLFELGNVFAPERTRVAGIIAEKHYSRERALFFELKGALSLFFEQLGVDAWFDLLHVAGKAGDMSLPEGHVFHPHRAAVIKIGEKSVGSMGEAHPRMLKTYGITGSVALFELDADILTRLTLEEKEFRPISRYPAVMRDISLLVSSDTRMVEVLDVIENTGGELLVDTDLIDMYAGAELPDGKKNFSFRLVFQARDRTLTDKEITSSMSLIIKTLQDTNLEWEVR